MKYCLFKDCQKEFEPNKPKQKFCSDKCRVYYSRSLKPKKSKPVLEKKISEIRDIKNVSFNFDKESILKQIYAIEKEIIPSVRDTSLGRRIWAAEQQQKIKQLQLQING